MSNNVQKQASLSLGSVGGGRLPMLHYASDSVKEDKSDHWLKTALMRGWLLGHAAESRFSESTAHERIEVIPIRNAFHRIRFKGLPSRRRGCFTQMAVSHPVRIRNLPVVDEGEVGYSREDFSRLQSECLQLRQTQEKLLERVRIMDIEMEVRIQQMAHVLESNNTALRETMEQLQSSKDVIRYLQEAVLDRDHEIDRLSIALTESVEDRQSPSQD